MRGGGEPPEARGQCLILMRCNCLCGWALAVLWSLCFLAWLPFLSLRPHLKG